MQPKQAQPLTETYLTQRQILIAYLKMKVDQADWHGVSDAANDLRVLEAENTQRVKTCLDGIEALGNAFSNQPD